jgi:hypothetical protein
MIRITFKIITFVVVFSHFLLVTAAAQYKRDIILFDFEDGLLNGWELTGKSFLVSDGPVHKDTVVKWERGPVGFHENYYLETGQDQGRHTNKNGGGTLRSPGFKINRNYLNFYLAGQLNPGVRVFLEVDGVIVKEAFGNNFYDLILRGWDVREFRNKTARFGLEDRSNLRSLIRLDHIFLSDQAPPGEESWVKTKDRQRSSIVAPGEFIRIFDNNQIIDGDWLTEKASIVFGPDNRWHLFAQVIEASNVWEQRNPGKVIHAYSDDLLGDWVYNGVVLSADARFGEQFIMDPFVLVHDGNFYMYYVGSGNLWSGWYTGPEGNNNPWHLGASGDFGPNSMFLAVSENGYDWERVGNADPNRPGKIFTEKPFGLTPYVHRIGDKWVMYYASAEDETVFSKHTIGYRTSPDLVNWSNRKQALVDWSLTDTLEAARFGRHIPASPWPEHSFFTNPVVFSRGDTWHLWAGPIDNSNLSRYHCLRIYKSDDPFSFSGHWAAKEINKRVFVDGGGRPFRDQRGNWFIFHTNNMSGGIWVAPLFWNDGKDEKITTMKKAEAN